MKNKNCLYAEEVIKFSLYFPFLLFYICFSLALFPSLRNINGAYTISNIF